VRPVRPEILAGASASATSERTSAATTASEQHDARAHTGGPSGFRRDVLALWLTHTKPERASPQAVDLHLEAFMAQVRRVVHELTLWAKALGSAPAAQLLAELYASGTLTPPANPSAPTDRQLLSDQCRRVIQLAEKLRPAVPKDGVLAELRDGKGRQ
jgi:hypothetical protein